MGTGTDACDVERRWRWHARDEAKSAEARRGGRVIMRCKEPEWSKQMEVSRGLVSGTDGEGVSGGTGYDDLDK